MRAMVGQEVGGRGLKVCSAQTFGDLPRVPLSGPLEDPQKPFHPPPKNLHTMQRSDFRFLEPLRVRWSEVDLQKIVFNGHYLMYFDTAVAGYWRALAMPYHDTMASLNGDLFVRKATLEYAGSARYDEQLQIGIRCARIGNSSMRFAAAVFRGPALLVHGELIYVFADPATQTSEPVPAALREVLMGFEAGEPMLNISADASVAGTLQRVAHNRFGVRVGTARMALADTANEGANANAAPGLVDVDVVESLRGAGIGHALIAAVQAAAQEQGCQASLAATDDDTL
jgi:YbgC/YbaW family acyl-CoA thioester hydrolase